MNDLVAVEAMHFGFDALCVVLVFCALRGRLLKGNFGAQSQPRKQKPEPEGKPETAAGPVEEPVPLHGEAA